MPEALSNISQSLTAIIERIENLEGEKSEIASEIKNVYSEAKSTGLSTKTIREMVKIRKMNAEKREEWEFLRDSYLRALGLLSDTQD